MGIGESLAGIMRAVILAIIAAFCLVLFMNLAFFFPWYLTIVEKAFVISQHIATDNYLTLNNYNRIGEELRKGPIFNKSNYDIEIKAWHIDADKDAIQHTYKPYYSDIDECYYKDDSPDADEDYYKYKPYVQMGNPVHITINAAYPLQMKFFGRDMYDLFPDLREIEVSFSMNTTTTKHYKDLKYEYASEENGINEDDWFDWVPDDDWW